MSKFKDIYLSEAEDHLQKFNDNLLLLEKTPGDTAILNELMRSSHTLKSSSAAMGYIKTAFLTHVMEDVFDAARNGKLPISKAMMNALFKTVDALEKSILSVKKKNKEIDVEKEANALKKLSGVATEGFGKSVRTADGKPIKRSSNRQSHSANEEASQLEISKATSKSDDAPLPASETEKIEHIKVPVERLDRLMALLEELVIDKMKLAEAAKTLPEIEPLSAHLSRLVSDLQYQVMQTRLVPLEQVFARFPRMVRDLASQFKKQVDFQIVGGEIELDRTIVDKLAEPLVHLLKNAVDHGVEKVGMVRLTAERQKELVVIAVENNGRPIDYAEVRRVAISRNIVSAREAERLNEHDLTKLLYHPRLSTKKEVTEVSGRGIGLNIVKNFADENGGRVEVVSPLTSGGGARFTLLLPLSLAIINSLLVEVGGALFAIPFSAIGRSVRIPASDIKSMADQDVAVVDGTDVPLVHLSKLFKQAEKEMAKTDGKAKGAVLVDEPAARSVLAVLVQRGQESAGLVVDALHDELEIIVKPLPAVLKKTKGFSGSTILGDGRTVLIVDTLSLLEDATLLIRTKNN